MGVSSPIVIPHFLDPIYGGDVSLHALKDKCDAAKILGLVRCEKAEILLVYNGQYLSTCLFVV
jgi:hypothetical protein